MMPGRHGKPQPPPRTDEAAERKDEAPEREDESPDREEMIDQVLEATFPASDPPTWDSVARTPPAAEDEASAADSRPQRP